MRTEFEKKEKKSEIDLPLHISGNKPVSMRFDSFEISRMKDDDENGRDVHSFHTGLYNTVYCRDI